MKYLDADVKKRGYYYVLLTSAVGAKGSGEGWFQKG